MKPSDNAERCRQIRDGLRTMTGRVDEIHRDIRALCVQVEELEHAADVAELSTVRYALRTIYVKLSQSGSQLVEAHVEINNIPGVCEE